MHNKPLKGGSLFLGAIALSSCSFMQVLDYSVANVSIPYISGGLATSFNDGTWVITMFAVGNASALPMTGFLTRRMGSVKLMLLSISLFAFFSWMCGMSFDLKMLVTLRFLQGIAAGPMMPLSQSLMLMTFPKDKKHFALSLWGMITIIGNMAGPVIGGWISFNYSWPWIFFVNIPISVFCFLAIRYIYKGRDTTVEKVRIDFVGILLLIFTVSTLQIFLDQGQQLDWWRSNIIITLAVISIISCTFLIIWELNYKSPILDLRMFKNRNYFIGTILMALSYMVIFGAVIVVTPLWLQEMMGYTAPKAGLAVATIAILPFLTVILVSKIMDKLKIKYLVAISFFTYGITLFYYSTFTTAVSFEIIALSRVFLGIGICTWLAPTTAITFSDVSIEKIAMGQGMFHFLKILMGGVGTSIFVTLWRRRGTYHHSYLVDTINPYNPISKDLFGDLKQHGVIGNEALKMVDSMAWKQAMMLSLNDIYWLAGWVFIVFIVCTFFFKKKKELTFTETSSLGH